MSWTGTSVKYLGKIVTGGTPSTKKKEFYGGDIPFYKPGDLNQGYFTQKAATNLTELGYQKTRPLPEKSILITCIGSIGKTGFIRKAGASNQQINAIIPYPGIMPELVYYFCISPQFQSQLLKNSSATTISIINKGRFSNLFFPLPPFAEQQRIVAKLDLLFGHLERLKARMARIPELLQAFRQSVLTQAVTGKLTEEWRKGKSMESAKILLDKIKLIDNEITELDSSLPDSWVRFKLGEVFKIVRGSSPRPKGDPKYFAKGRTDYHWIKIADFAKYSTNNKLIDTEEFLTKAGTKYSRHVDQSDLLVAASGVGSVGKSIELGIPGYIYDGIMAVKNIPNRTMRKFLGYFMKLQEFKFYTVATGTSWLNINTSILKNYECPMPPLLELEEIVNRVEILLKKSDELESQYIQLKTRIENLPQSILAKAFSGKLVSQLPGDIPAEELLIEIKNSGESIPSASKS